MTKAPGILDSLLAEGAAGGYAPLVRLHAEGQAIAGVVEEVGERRYNRAGHPLVTIRVLEARNIETDTRVRLHLAHRDLRGCVVQVDDTLAIEVVSKGGQGTRLRYAVQKGNPGATVEKDPWAQ
jgi:hypothetical protein